MGILKVVGYLANILSYLKYKEDRLRLKKRIKDGLKVGKNVYIMENVEFDINYPFLIEIGDNCRISKGVRILSHDATTFRRLGVTRLAPVKILEGSFIGEKAIILPGVTIGPNALVAAGSVVNRDIAEDKAVAGNPARPYGNFSDLVNKYQEVAKESVIIDKRESETGVVDNRKMEKIVKKEKIAFVKGVPSSDPYYVNFDMAAIIKEAEDGFKKITTS